MKLILGAAAAVTAYALLAEPLRKYLRRRTASIKLTYFNLDGLGEPIRLTLALAGARFEDYRFKSRDEFGALKPKLRFGQVPCLEVNGTELVQSAAVMRYVARAFDTSGLLYPSDLQAAALVDALIDQVKDMTTGRMVFRYKARFWGSAADAILTESVVESIEKAWLEEVLPTHLAFFAKVASESPTQWLAGTASPTIADIMVATQLKMLSAFSGKLPGSLDAYVNNVYALPAVVAWRQREAELK
uniref:Glutathione transferase n=1 Tax=Coccolithus braarudii TaxID=221442 RepID=A0A7S0PYV3_9EUKA|mmetsp:Transcript_23713/g.51126  ORF Transcript_23713/g.51126 Transcript_23713/m.51126 type:complete len:245 (+) Transcript_23713:32-766(+)|eukprot:CAMPEP_0183336240 /NCGR_PEP_ID=MMETSP0164_2-20130417/4275_1 /TAXON_ID=221442 /ORGANISM="Coccolithus pelagicus ssp braarudi, Strain PLY182g" /LENGTH=244 /DNA_ID=CAMNT_0025505721 /DNA_START=30 /DNA_END=764 /DNA_ORIENTATION=-